MIYGEWYCHTKIESCEVLVGQGSKSRDRIITYAGEDMRQEERGTFQMMWDCSNCGTNGLLGVSHRHCPTCGAAQDPASRYFPSDDQKVSIENHRYTGADWKCPACDTPNSNVSTFCINCGSGKDGSKEVKRRAEQSTEAGQAFAGDSAKAARSELASRPAGPPQEAPKRSTGGGWIIAVIIGVVVLLGVALSWKRDATVSVIGHSWERSIGVEAFGPDSQEAWRDQLPAGSYNVSCHEAVRSTKQIPDGETCRDKRVDQGDGSFKEVRECKPKFREEPIYDQQCRYLIDIWKEVRRETAAGKSLAEKPEWPRIQLAQAGNCRGCEREGSRSESYTVILKDSEKSETTYECTLPEARWMALAVGAVRKAKAGVLTGKLDCSELEKGN